MDFSINVEKKGEIKLKTLRFAGEENIFRFIPLGGGKVYFHVVLDGANYIIANLSDEVLDSENDLRRKVDEWLVENNTNESFGTEETEDDEGEIEKPYDPENIRVDTKTFSLKHIYEMIKSGDIDLSPDFQRHLVWDNKRKSLLIESILLRIPLPMFYFAQDEEGKITVVDGLQRLNAIKEFMDNSLKLNKLEYLEEKCGGKYYSLGNKSSIDQKYVRWFNMTQITVNIIDPSSPFNLKYDIFRRINTGGQPLNAQEIRNCLSSHRLRKILQEMASLPSFIEATGNSVKDVRMEAQELALRFILFQRKYEIDPNLLNYSGNAENELNNLTEELSNDKTIDVDVFVSSFDTAMKNAYHLFGDYAFRKCKLEHLQPQARRQLVNKALFVSWSVLLSQYKYDIVTSRCQFGLLSKPQAEIIDNDQDIFQALSYGTNSRLNIQVAFGLAKKIIKTNLKI